MKKCGDVTTFFGTGLDFKLYPPHLKSGSGHAFLKKHLLSSFRDVSKLGDKIYVELLLTVREVFDQIEALNKTPD